MKTFITAFLMVLATTALAPTVCDAARTSPERLRVGPYELSLNGAGTRSTNFLSLYVASLYLGQGDSDAARIIAADAPMAIRIEITSIFVSQAKLVDALNEGFQKSTGGDIGAIKNEIYQFRQCFTERIAKGDIFQIVYVPGHGVVVAKNGRRQGLIPGLPFKRAVFGIWLGNDPADADLKRALLGL